VIVQVTPDWRISSDSHCFICQKRRIRKDTVEWRSETFHATFEDACEYILELRLRDDTTELKSLRDALAHVRDMRQRFRDELMDSSGAPSQEHCRSDLEGVV
jgi:hypothetical protein